MKKKKQKSLNQYALRNISGLKGIAFAIHYTNGLAMCCVTALPLLE